MRDVLDDLLRWWQVGQPVAMATVVATWKSAPRPPGATMLVGPDGTAVGSVSGGCVEGAVYELCQEAIADGVPRLQRYGVSDDDAFSVGLTCGGTIELFVERVDRETFPWLARVAESIDKGVPVAVLTCVEGPPDRLGRHLVIGPGFGEIRSEERSDEDGSIRLPGATSERSERGKQGPGFGEIRSEERSDEDGSRRRPGAGSERSERGKHSPGAASEREGTLGSERLDDAATDDGRGLLAAGRTGILHYGPDGQRRGSGLSVLVRAYAPRPRMIVFGAIDFAAAVARIGTFLGYRVTVCDARPVFATAKRFPEADEVIVDWPHRYLTGEAGAGRLDERTVVCVLTHDPKFDVPVLRVALDMPLAYVGAMGSRRTHDDRLARLREAGVGDDSLARLASPIGLDLGARTPEETAVSIAAEIIAARWGGQGVRLSETTGRIHG